MERKIPNENVTEKDLKRIIKQAKGYLKENGLIAFELGIRQANKVKNMLEKNNFTNINITKDYNLIERVITASS